MDIDRVLQERRDQEESVRGKDTPFRVEFRFSGGTRHYQYFAKAEDAKGAVDYSCSYSPFGKPRIESPLSRQLQIRGPRGGWKPARELEGK